MVAVSCRGASYKPTLPSVIRHVTQPRHHPHAAQVARLREQLQRFGVDVDALLADIVAAGEAETGSGDADLT